MRTTGKSEKPRFPKKLTGHRSRQFVFNTRTNCRERCPVFNNILDVPVNGVAIQTANVTIPISQPNNTWNFIVRGDHRIREGDNLATSHSEAAAPAIESA